MVLYENTVKQFMRDIRARRISKFIVSEYESRSQTSVPLDIGFTIKYLMQILSDKVLERNADPNCGVRIEIEECSRVCHISITFASFRDGVFNYCIIGAYPGSKISLTKADDIVLFEEMKRSWTGIHPVRQMTTAANSIARGIDENSLDEVSVGSCAFLFDCPYSEETDILCKYSDQLSITASLFYANDEEDLVEFLRPALNGGSGAEALEKLRSIERNAATKPGYELNEEQRYLVSSIINNVRKGNKAWYIIQGQAKSGRSTIIDRAAEKLTAEGNKLVCFQASDIPEEKVDLAVIEELGENTVAQLECARIVVMTCGSVALTEETFEVLDAIKELADKKGVTLYHDILKQSLSPDSGKGLRWLTEKLQIADFNAEDYDPDYFLIEAFSADEPEEETDGVANVTIGSNVVYDPETGEVRMNSAEKAHIYSCISEGVRGVRLYCEDENLAKYVNGEVETLKKRIEWVENFLQSGASTDEAGIAGSENMLQLDKSICTDYEQHASKAFGERAWSMLGDESKNWIVSAMMAYDYLKLYNTQLDFSGVCVQVSKACEKELGYRIFEQFIVFLSEKYGDNYVRKLPYEVMEKDKNGKPIFKLIDTSRITLGSMRFIMGIDTRGNITSEYGWKEFEDYAKTELLVNTENIKEQLTEHACIINKIKNDYRNRSAHKEAMSIIDAKECLEYVVLVTRKLGEILDSYRF